MRWIRGRSQKWLKEINEVRKMSTQWENRGVAMNWEEEGRVCYCEKIKQLLKGLLFTWQQERWPRSYGPRGPESPSPVAVETGINSAWQAMLGQNERSLRCWAALWQLTHILKWSLLAWAHIKREGLVCVRTHSSLVSSPIASGEDK